MPTLGFIYPVFSSRRGGGAPKLRANLLSACAVLVMAATLMVSTVGCTPAQQQTTLQVVTAINAKIPEIVAAADTVAATISVLAPADAALIATCDVGFDTLASTLQALTKAYIANPNATTLQQIQTAINTLEANISTATLNVAGIKDAASQKLALAALKAFATAVTFAFALIAPTETTAMLRELQGTGAIQIAVIRRGVDEPRLRRELAAQGVNLDQVYAGAELYGF